MLLIYLICITCISSVFSQSSSWDPFYGNFQFPITGTCNSNASYYFNEGVMTEFNFNQKVARSYFQRCIDSDPLCPMCYWGLSFSYGPYLNHPMILDHSQLAIAYNASQTAFQLFQRSKAPLTNLETVLITAQSVRFPSPNSTNWINQTLDFINYSSHLLEQYELNPSDQNIAVFAAESILILMCNASGYNFYDPITKVPYSKTVQATDILEKVLGVPDNNTHPYAAHLYIHTTEISAAGAINNGTNAARALPYAYNLLQQQALTQAQHLQHMAGHTFCRTGDYHSIVLANTLAHESDAKLFKHHLQPYAPAHNVAFLITGACMEGSLKIAEEYGLTLRSIYQANPTYNDGPGPERGWAIPLTSYVRFGLFEEVLADQVPLPLINGSDPDWPYNSVLTHYTRGIALSALGKPDLAFSQELVPLQSYYSSLDTDTKDMFKVANLTLSASILYHDLERTRQGFGKEEYDELKWRDGVRNVVELLTEAVEEEISWGYHEPPLWQQPVRHCLGQVLLNTQDYSHAEQVFRDDLAIWIENSWSLLGLAQAMKGQPEKYSPGDVLNMMNRADAAFTYGDQPLITPCYAFAVTISKT